MSEKKTSSFLQIVKGLAYFLLFLFSNVLMSSVFLIYFSVEKGRADVAAGLSIDMDALITYGVDKTNEHSNLLLFLYSLLFFLFLLLIFAIRKKKFLEEIQLRRFSPRYVPSLLLMAVALLLLVDSVLSLLPAEWMTSYVEASDFIGRGSLWGSLVAQAIIAPVTEEVAFRGLMLSRFNKALPRWFGVLCTSFFFGLVHGNPVWFVYAALLGILFSIVANRTNSILSSILLHALFNALGTLLSYLPIAFTPVIFGITAVIGLALLLLGLWLFFRKPGNEPNK